jgi:NAD(P)H dehydrogenase (quinone)
MPVESPSLFTGAAGRVGGVGRAVVEKLRRRGLPVRAMVHREDERAAALRATGAEVVVGDLTAPIDVARAMEGCRRIYFGMSVSASYLEPTVTAAAVARERGDLEAFVNISQMTVSQMSLTNMTDSPQQRQHWLAEQALNWSGLPVVQVRPTVFLENPLFMSLAAGSIAQDNTIRLPFGNGRTSPIAADDVAEVIATILANPAPHVGQIYQLTGPKSQDMTGVAAEYFSRARPQDYLCGCAPGAMERVGSSKPESAGAGSPALEQCQSIYNQRSHIPARFRDLVWSSYFHINSRMTSRLRAGRVFLGADAAHIHSPAGAQGMNTGIQDMINLCWKLALTIKDHSSAGLLDTYEQDRLAIIRNVLQRTEQLTGMISSESHIFRTLFNQSRPLDCRERLGPGDRRSAYESARRRLSIKPAFRRSRAAAGNSRGRSSARCTCPSDSRHGGRSADGPANQFIQAARPIPFHRDRCRWIIQRR